MCSAIIIIPGMEEPTQNLNTTLALGIISFLYIQAYAIKSHGFVHYISEYFQPFIFGIPNIFLFPLHLVGKLASVVSISFRLFGNIFGGATISALFVGAIKGSLVGESLGLIMNICVLLPFGLFEGFLQAFVFSMLTITYLSLELKEEAEPFSEAVTW
jgi:F-type H+-transporting ATPase subunit a